MPKNRASRTAATASELGECSRGTAGGSIGISATVQAITTRRSSCVGSTAPIPRTLTLQSIGAKFTGTRSHSLLNAAHAFPGLMRNLQRGVVISS